MATNSKITYTLELDSTGAVRSINQTAKEFSALDSKVKSLTSSMKKQIEDEKLETLVRLIDLMSDIEIIEVHLFKEVV